MIIQHCIKKVLQNRKKVQLSIQKLYENVAFYEFGTHSWKTIILAYSYTTNAMYPHRIRRLDFAIVPNRIDSSMIINCKRY